MRVFFFGIYADVEKMYGYLVWSLLYLFWSDSQPDLSTKPFGFFDLVWDNCFLKKILKLHVSWSLSIKLDKGYEVLLPISFFIKLVANFPNLLNRRFSCEEFSNFKMVRKVIFSLKEYLVINTSPVYSNSSDLDGACCNSE